MAIAAPRNPNPGACARLLGKHCCCRCRVMSCLRCALHSLCACVRVCAPLWYTLPHKRPFHFGHRKAAHHESPMGGSSRPRQQAAIARKKCAPPAEQAQQPPHGGAARKQKPNAPCRCGSGKKFKLCCRSRRAASPAPAAAEAVARGGGRPAGLHLQEAQERRAPLTLWNAACEAAARGDRRGYEDLMRKAAEGGLRCVGQGNKQHSTKFDPVITASRGHGRAPWLWASGR